MPTSEPPGALAANRRGRRTAPAKRISGQTVFLAVVLAIGVAVAGYIVLAETAGRAAAPVSPRLEDIPFDGAAAYEYLKELCKLGPRFSGSPGMEAQQKLLVDHFQKLGATVTRQEFRARHPVTGEAVPMTNLIVQWHPDRKERVLLCAHYDTRPFPDRDPRRPRGTFIGANDGASGVALLMELGKAMPQFQSRYGVDFLLVDGEDLVFWDAASNKDTGSYCVGSEHFARLYAADPPPYKYLWSVVLDMIAGPNLKLPKERNSLSWPDSKQLVEDIWATAARLKVREFIPQTTPYPITDDHVMLHDVGRIPACDIINMDYPQWHTEADDPAHCSPLSLAKVGWVIHQWLLSLK